jgi:hypothetical protein
MAKRNSNGRIVIKSSDNDVLLLSLHFYSKMTSIDELWDIVFGKLHHRLLVLKITSQENFTFSDRDTQSTNG